MDVNQYIEKIILTYKSSIRFRIGFAGLIIFAGLLIILLNAFILSFPEELKSLVSISGTLISSVCAFPIKEIVDRRNKIQLMNELSEQHKHSSGADKKKLEDLIWKLIEKSTIG